jgi:tetrahydrodipicolinate N-succinyltransferase
LDNEVKSGYTLLGGTKVEEEAILDANVILTQSTKIIDVSGNGPVNIKEVYRQEVL